MCAAIAAVAGALAFSGPGAQAATPLTDYSTNLTRGESSNPQESGGWARRLRTVPDLNGDGKNELLVAAYRESFGGFSVAGRVYMQDGATRGILYFIDAPQIQSNAEFGFLPGVLGDVNGDGKADFVSGARGQDTLAAGASCTPPPTGPLGLCNQDQGKAWVFSGANGDTLYELNNPNPQGFANFGLAGRAGDINGDGISDIVVGAYANDLPAGCGNGADGRRLPAASVPAGCRADEGEAFIFSGKASDHAGGASGLLRTLNVPASSRAPAPCGGFGAGSVPCGSFGLSPQGVGDVTGDGVVDQFINSLSFNLDTATNDTCTNPAAPTCSRGQGAVYLFNGATGALIRRSDNPVSQAGAQSGSQDHEPLAPGDVNGDGRADYYMNAPLQDGPAGEPGAGRSWVLSGATGSVLYEVKDPTPTELGSFGFSMSKTDYNKDGTPDLYVGQNPHHTTGGEVDTSGGTYVFNGKNGSLLKSLELPPSDAQRGAPGNLGNVLGWTVAAPGDLNGDGEPDYVAGAPTTDVGPSAFNCQAPTPGCVKDAGREYFFYSRVPRATPAPNYPGPATPSAGGKTFNGTSGNDTITGTAGNDVINCGAGDDVVNAGGGDDVINCGAGNDRVNGNAGNDRINGESGNDLLSGNEGNDRVVGGSGNDRANGNEGNDRVGGQSGNDRVGGQSGRDTLNGDSGRDRVSGGSSNDRVSGGRGNDRVNGDSGNDRVSGGSGRDALSGAAGRDSISARDRTRDTVNCGRGRDSVSADRRRGRDRVARNCERVRRR